MGNNEQNNHPEDTQVDTGYVHSTTKQAAIKLTSKDIFVFVNEEGKTTPVLIVALAKLDNIEYAALFDQYDKKAYAVEVIRKNGQIKYFRDLDGPGQDHEWAVISNFFLKEQVYDYNRISFWIYNTTQLYQRYGKKAPAIRMKRKRK